MFKLFCTSCSKFRYRKGYCFLIYKCIDNPDLVFAISEQSFPNAVIMPFVNCSKVKKIQEQQNKVEKNLNFFGKLDSLSIDDLLDFSKNVASFLKEKGEDKYVNKINYRIGVIRKERKEKELNLENVDKLIGLLSDIEKKGLI